MMLQQSRFTIHGDGAPLEDHPKSEEFLMKLEIPFAFRTSVGRSLEMLGIKRSTLFPELDHLAREIQDDEKKNIRI